jgi:hypothetical protein
MRAVTHATGPAHQPTGKGVAQPRLLRFTNRLFCSSEFTRSAVLPSASLSRRPAQQPEASAFQGARRFAHRLNASDFKRNRQLQCYIGVRLLTPHHSRITAHAVFNRQPRRLEITVSHTKQTTETHVNRQLFDTFAFQFREFNYRDQRIAVLPLANYQSRFTSHGISNRHTPRLDNAKNPTNSPLSAVLIDTFTHFRAAQIAGFRPRCPRIGSFHGPRFLERGARVAEHGSRLANHHSPIPPLRIGPTSARITS